MAKTSWRRTTAVALVVGLIAGNRLPRTWLTPEQPVDFFDVKGIVEALSRVDLRAPMVIRLDGTNAEQGREILKNAGIPESKLISKPTMLEAARTAVAIANGAN